MEVRVGVCRRGLQTLSVFKTKIRQFTTLFKTSHLFFDPENVYPVPEKHIFSGTYPFCPNR